MSVKRSVLQAISAQCGLNTSSPKKHLLEALKARAAHQLPQVFTSIDLGLKKFALAQFTLQKNNSDDYCISRWELHSLNLPEKYCPDRYAQIFRRFLSDNQLYNTPILLERQRQRTGGSLVVPGIILRLTSIEAQLHVLTQCQSILPAQVASYWNLPKGHQKKAAAVKIVQDLLDGGKIVVQDMSAWDQNKHKRDDLADAMLQGLAYHAWHSNARCFIQETLPAVVNQTSTDEGSIFGAARKSSITAAQSTKLS